MLYEYYKAVKTAIEDAEGTDRFVGQPNRLKNRINSVEWFNNQYEGTILNHPVAFIEFPNNLEIMHVTKDLERALLNIRVHVVSKVIQKADSAIPDQEIINHEALCSSVLAALRGKQLSDNSGQLTAKLRWTGWTHWHKYQGWMVTWIEFAGYTMGL